MSQEHPTISFVIITTNASKELQYKITQIKKEKANTWHCIILDNGSSDDTGFVSRKLVDADARIRYIYQQKQPINVARENALEVCLSKDIRFIEIN